MGLEVQAGFIVGFDSDDPRSIFQDTINFVQKSGIVTAMVGLLHAPSGTRLHKRLKGEDRLTGSFTAITPTWPSISCPRWTLAH